jgi:hypothetical protein
VSQGKIDGYVKPLFRDMDVYDERQDREKNVFRKMYEGLVGGVSSLLTNRPREEVATPTSISGDIESPQTSTWKTMLRLVQNAFFKAILPDSKKKFPQSAPLANGNRRPEGNLSLTRAFEDFSKPLKVDDDPAALAKDNPLAVKSIEVLGDLLARGSHNRGKNFVTDI